MKATLLIALFVTLIGVFLLPSITLGAVIF